MGRNEFLCRLPRVMAVLERSEPHGTRRAALYFLICNGGDDE